MFIGASRNAHKSELLNPEMLDFKKDPETHLFIASTDSILRVQNFALGYRIFVLLKDFQWNERQGKLIWSFSARFEEVEPETKREARMW